MTQLIPLFILTTTTWLLTVAAAQSCRPSSHLTVTTSPPLNQCNPQQAECCVPGRRYPVYSCSPPVSQNTAAVLSLNDFSEGGDRGGASQCDERFHSNNERVVALSTGWFNHKRRCGKEIIIRGNGRQVRAQVVDQCDSTQGCDAEHGYQRPCRSNIVDGSKAVWKALGVRPNSDEYGQMDITWADA